MGTHYDNLKQCLEKIIKSAPAKFNESIDIAVNLGINSRKSEEQVRGIVVLPKGVGKDIKVAVFIQSNHLLEVEKVSADIIGGEDLVEEIKKGRKLDVDWCITTPDFITKITPIAKILSAKGLMPNPKFGTVTPNIAGTIKTIKSGQVKFRTDKNGIIHSKLGNIKFSIDDLLENFKAFLKAIKNNKPISAKGVYFKNVFLSSTMGKAYEISKVEDIIRE
ncbi:50S ribosomal protein L1 [Wolbachia endosymbiont of Dirofilaria (Dirofilaria) immitis]|uniref:50S ribosomal protein L1 n=1 Tax=Wolbachia endosymbiont of Dirofilaria (Dirofilaria) immitis TaxID=1812115 RepID=UPI0015895016|nr:50S ribosomal protein L1 [Wolbachia endosymbiont of Dirofilaria (Dirofilaria) immitis]QKX02462.1 50S ribosomal protein L1 [Wolbachia endosymbiont of Dirofilaria (Dirofilaria) immitis]